MTHGTRHSVLGTRLSAASLILAGIAVTGARAQTAPPSTDVYLVRLDRPTTPVINITNRAGYDNQPAWVRDAVFWTAQVDGQTDIYQLDFMSSAKGAVVKTPESEYSSAATPDGTGYAVIRVELDSTQRLWRFPLGGGAPSVVLADIKPVGYFAYLDANTLALFVLGRPNTLQIADTRTGKGVVAATNIGRSLQHVPGGRRASFTQTSGGKTWLETVDPTPRSDGTFAIDTIAALPDSADFVVWRSSNEVITGAGSRLMRLQLPSREWTVLADLTGQGIRRISRLALSPRGDRLALVADEPTKP